MNFVDNFEVVINGYITIVNLSLSYNVATINQFLKTF